VTVDRYDCGGAAEVQQAAAAVRAIVGHLLRASALRGGQVRWGGHAACFYIQRGRNAKRRRERS
jgi:hypothetical protein